MGINIEDWIPADRGKPNILKLFYPILFIQVLVATQFIIIDSWVLTMLKKFVLLFPINLNVKIK